MIAYVPALLLLCLPGQSLKVAESDAARPRRRPAVPAGFLPDANLTDEKYFAALGARIKGICGEVCTLARPGRKGKFFGRIDKKNQCDKLFTDDMMNLDGLSNRWPPPQQIPQSMFGDFTMGNASMEITPKFSMASTASKPQLWTGKFVNKLIRKARLRDFRRLMGGYPMVDGRVMYGMLEKYKTNLAGAHCAVVGSQAPWVEALLLAAGVKHVTTVEYGDITSQHPSITTVHPFETGKLYAKSGKSGMFDCVVAYSSLEHAGLGRFGDIVNPWADLIAVERYKCLLKQGGLMLIGVPSTREDSIYFNGGRRYGPKRWAQLLANMEQLEYQKPPRASWDQALVVARKS